MKLILLPLLLSILFSNSQLADRIAIKVLNDKITNTDSIVAKLQRNIPILMKRSNMPGLSVALVPNGKLVWSKGFGVMNADTKQPVTTEMVFKIAVRMRDRYKYKYGIGFWSGAGIYSLINMMMNLDHRS